MKSFITQPIIKDSGLYRNKRPLGVRKALPERQTNAMPPEKKQSAAVVRRMEETVTLLQIAMSGAADLLIHLEELREFIQGIGFHESVAIIPDSVSQNYLDDKLLRLRSIIARCQYGGHTLLGGDLEPQVLVSGERTTWVRSCGALPTQTDGARPYSVYVHRQASRSTLVGWDSISRQLLAQEKSITLVEGKNVVQYQIQPEETPASLVIELQKELDTCGMGITVSLDDEERLVFTHNQSGSGYKFQASSQYTSMISPDFGALVDATPGKDIQGTIGGEVATGVGDFLISPNQNPQTGGIVLYCNSETNLADGSLGFIRIFDRSWKYPLNLSRSSHLTLPSLDPKSLGVGVWNHSGYTSLADIKASSRKQCADAVLLITWVMEDINMLLKKWTQKETEIVELTLAVMRESMMDKSSIEVDPVVVSRSKAKEMSSYLKRQLLEKNQGSVMVV